MNVIWIVADTFRQDHLGAYGKSNAITPSLDALASRSTRFERHYAAGFPTMPTRADHATGRWTMSFMGWEPIPDNAITLAEILSKSGVHTAAMVDTPFYLRGGMNYDKGFQTFSMHSGQEGSVTRLKDTHHHESRDIRESWRFESDRNVAQTVSKAMEWLQLHHKEEFFLYLDTWDPHEPWDAPSYYTEMYMPDYDGEIVQPIYGNWTDSPGLTANHVNKAFATYKGEVTMVDTWIGYLLRMVENMGLMENTAIIFTSDHGDNLGDFNIWDKRYFYENSVKVPFFILGPNIPHGKRLNGPLISKRLISHLDIYPTILYLSQTKNKFINRIGYNLFSKNKYFIRNHVLSEIGTQTMIRTANWKLVFDPEQDGVQYLYNLITDK